VFTRASVYFNIPKFAVVRFFVTPMGERIIACMEQCFLCLTLLGASSVPHSFRLLQDTSPSF
jgi:hypothetical protein